MMPRIYPATPPPRTFYPLLLLFHLFPLHAPVTLWILDAPFGRFAIPSRLNLDGNWAWAGMELVAPITFYANLSSLTPRARILAALYFVHYAHRAVLSPLLLAPKRAKIHASVAATAVLFNLLNATLQAGALSSYPPPGGWTFWAGVALWASAFAGNVYHDEILHDLRRPPSRRLVSRPQDDGPSDKDGRYRVPQGGLFALVSFPNYLCEWLEWTGFALAASPAPLVAVPPLASLALPWARALAPMWPAAMLAAPWAFVLAEVTSMLPRALRGHAWYRRTFETYPAKRRAAIPYVL